MKEDVLEQLVDDYLQHRGYFTRHNIKFRPEPSHPDFEKRQDSNHSDIDVIGFTPSLSGYKRVMVVNCKSWQSGFSPSSILKAFKENKKAGGKEAWRGFRELVKPKWAEAFLKKIKEITGSTKFTYVMAVTHVKGDGHENWEKHPDFKQALQGNPVNILTVSTILDELYLSLGRTMASSEIGRTLQLIKASGWKPPDN